MLVFLPLLLQCFQFVALAAMLVNILFGWSCCQSSLILPSFNATFVVTVAALVVVMGVLFGGCPSLLPWFKGTAHVLGPSL